MIVRVALYSLLLAGLALREWWTRPPAYEATASSRET
jgi:hypothetical protein